MRPPFHCWRWVRSSSQNARLRLTASLSCSAHWPHIDAVFVAALLGSALLNWAAILLSSHALSRADATLVTPLLTFNSAFTLLVALVVPVDIPGLQEVLGVAGLLLVA